MDKLDFAPIKVKVLDLSINAYGFLVVRTSSDLLATNDIVIFDDIPEFPFRVTAVSGNYQLKPLWVDENEQLSLRWDLTKLVLVGQIIAE